MTHFHRLYARVQTIHTRQRKKKTLERRRRRWTSSSLVILLSVSAALSLAQVLPLDASGTAATERRSQRKIDVLLRIQADQEARNIHQLLADAGNLRRIFL